MSCRRGCCPDQLTHYRSVSIAASACPSRAGGRAAVAINRREERWDRDMPAYKRLRQEGLQPSGIDGAATLEARAESKVEIETGRLLTAPQRTQLKAVAEVAE